MSGWTMALIVLLLCGAGCASPLPAPPRDTTVALHSLFNYDGVRCIICHKAIRRQDGRAWTVNVQGTMTLYAHERCCALELHE